MGKDQELLEAARNGNAPVVEKILSQRAKRSGPLASLRRGPGANVQDASGYSALHHAALNGHQDVVELLLTHEASTNILDAKGSSPLHLAAWAGNIDIVRLLLCHGPSVPNVNLTTKDHETALHCAAQYGHTEIVTLLLEHSCDPTIRNSREETALDLAAQYGRLETVELLVRTHPELIQPYSRSYKTGYVFPHTPLHLASRNGHKLVVEVLLSSGMDVNIKTSGGTALHEAALCGKLDVVRTLLDAGVDLQLRDAKQNTVLDLLKQFPRHVTQDIFRTIKRHPNLHKGAESESDGEQLPLAPASLPDLGSPYENVRAGPDQGRRARHSGMGTDSSPGSSPIQNWDYYSQNKKDVSYLDISKLLMDPSALSDDLYQRDPDQISISSAASSTSGLSSRDRRLIASDCTGSYVPMGPGSIPSPGPSGSKISPTPPKKPPRRNLSVSPTHLSPNVSLPSPSAYEYLYLSRTGNEVAPVSRKPEVLRRGKSADQYEVMKLRQNYVAPIDISELKNSPAFQRRKSEDSGKHLQEKREPVALTMYFDNVQVRTTNPRRKLRRNPSDRDKVYENYEPPYLINANVGPDSAAEQNRTFVSNAYITLKSSQESLLDETGKKARTPVEGKNGATKIVCPLSPTNYQQPPTPDHPPPSALQAEIIIHERIRPLSQEYKRRSRDIETETDEELLIYPVSLDSSGSFSSSISLSDKSVSTDNNVEEFIGDVPFAGLFKGSTSQLIDSGQRVTPAERPKTLRKLKNVYENVAKEGNNVLVNDEPLSSASCNDKSLSILSPFDEQEEWAKISEIMASFSSGLVRDSIFVAEMEREIQTRLGLSSQKKPEDAVRIASKIGQWLQTMNLGKYESSFLDNGYDDVDFLNGVLDEEELRILGLSEQDAVVVAKELAKLPEKIAEIQKRYHTPVNHNNNSINGRSDNGERNHRLNNNNNNHNNSRNSNNVNNNIMYVKDEDIEVGECGEGGDENKENEEEARPERESELVDKWLDSIYLGVYKETFKKHLYLDMDRVRRIWEDELSSVLEIGKRGHRRRILASVNSPFKKEPKPAPNLEEITADLSQLKSNIQQLKDEIREKLPVGPPAAAGATSPGTHLAPAVPSAGTLRHSHKKNKPAPPPPVDSAKQPPDLSIRNPSELLVGVPSTITTQWRHRPEDLVTGNITYVANYLGSTVVKELKGTESTKKSIQKLKKTSRELTTTPDIILAISYRGVKFLNTGTQELVCEHEIRNIHCACQDADDLTHFAYITKDHISRSHYCHVFCVETMDKATEVILTLGQAFEVAYQITLREQISGSRRGNGHTRSQSVNQITENNAATLNNSHGHSQPQSNHSRSYSVAEMKLTESGKATSGSPESGKPEESCEKAPLVAKEDL